MDGILYVSLNKLHLDNRKQLINQDTMLQSSDLEPEKFLLYTRIAHI